MKYCTWQNIRWANCDAANKKTSHTRGLVPFFIPVSSLDAEDCLMIRIVVTEISAFHEGDEERFSRKFITFKLTLMHKLSKMKSYLLTLFLGTIFMLANTSSHSQYNFNAVLSPKGEVYYSINLGEFSVALNSFGQILGYTGKNNEKITYDLQDRIAALGDKKVTWDHLERLAGIGEVKFEYDMNQRVTTIGTVAVTYDFLTGKISAIDKLPIKYDFISQKVSQIATANISYDLQGEITGIQDPDKITVLKSASLSKH